MTIQEALNKVKELKEEANGIFQQALDQKTRTRYLDANAADYLPLDVITYSLINKYTELQKEIHQLKYHIQSTNIESGITQLIQELDFWSTQHSILEHFIGVKQITDPILVGERFGAPTSSSAFKVVEATYDVKKIQELSDKARKKINEIKAHIQKLNWEVELIEVPTLHT